MYDLCMYVLYDVCISREACDGESYLQPSGVQSESRQERIKAVKLCQNMTVILWNDW